MNAEAGAAEMVRRQLLSHHQGVLISDAGIETCRYVIDGQRDRVITTLPKAVLDAAEHVLHIPDEGDDSLQLLLDTPELLDEARDAVCDRWLAAHAKPEGVWMAMALISARLGGDVLDADEITPINPLGEADAKLCRALNAQPWGVLASLGEFSSPSESGAVVVSVDPEGATLRRDATETVRKRIVRLRWNFRLDNPDTAESELAAEIAAVSEGETA